MPIAEVITRGLGPAGSPPHWLITAGLGEADVPPAPVNPTTGPQAEVIMTATGSTALSRMLEELLAGTAFDSATVKLFVNDIYPSSASVPADFTEADYDGYAGQALGATAVAMLNEAGDVVFNFPHLVFTPTGSTTPNTVRGYWVEGVVGGTGTVVIWASRFDEAVPLTGTLTSAVVEPRFPLGQPQGT